MIQLNMYKKLFWLKPSEEGLFKKIHNHIDLYMQYRKFLLIIFLRFLNV